MGRKDSSSSASTTVGGKKDKPMSVSAMLASMDGPAAKGKSSKSAAPSKPKGKPSKAPASSYLADVDLPPLR
ncbi:hypothetical protein PR202_gb20317 [Eleusine coracana subsp. coracana]|uniref:Uncharacterized protein n=1 Tax=Eleusine coracana subsp. coracana TaxID=191504 RepID=A0AAV5FA73_ELECO|nr:hypothetical protein PR202_gb20317 [Eleusine coracana subsp. coracana]